MAQVIDSRRIYTKSRLESLAAELPEAEALIGDRACVYVTGSGGRGEISEHSDLDLFIVSDVEVRKNERASGEPVKPKLSRLDAICVKADLIKATTKLQFPPFSKDGKYLEVSTTEQLCENLGKPEDDYANTFTARLLLLLESRPLLGRTAYQRAIDEVINPYWADYEGRTDSFRPVFLINDIARLWKTLCVNYEAYTERQPDEKRAKRKLANYKLKNSRVLTCYSAVLYLMQVFSEQKTVHKQDVRDMVSKSPTERLEWIAHQPGFEHAQTIDRILTLYEDFLESTNQSEKDLIARFLDPEQERPLAARRQRVADTIADLLLKMATPNGLFRYLIV